MPPLEELKKRAYCKFHNSYSHATNDCNVFRRQIQSAINEGRLVFHNMQVDHDPFPVNAFMNTIEIQNPKVLIWPDQAEKAKGKNVIIGEERHEKKMSLKVNPQVSTKASTLGDQGKRKETGASKTGMTSSETGTFGLKTGTSGLSRGSRACSNLKSKVKPTFEELLAKYKSRGANQG